MLEREKLGRRRFLAGAAVASAATIMAACAPAPGTDPSQPGTEAKEGAPAKKEPVELSFGTWWLPPTPYGLAKEKAVAAFNESHDDIAVTVEPFQFNMEKWQAALAAGIPPDVTLMPPHFHHNFSSRNAMVAVDDLLANDPELDKDDFWPQTMDRLTWNGKLWGLPAEVWFQFTYVNTDMLGEAGLEMPSWDWTYEDYLELAGTLTQGEGPLKQFGTNAPTGMFYIPVWAWGGDLLDATEEKCVLDSAEAIEAVQWVGDLITKHKVAPSSEDLADTNDRSYFETGRVGMHVQANWYLSYCQKSAKMNWDVLPLPIGPTGRKSETRGANYGIFELTDHPEESWTLMRYMSVGEGQEIMITESALFPTLQRLGDLSKLPHYSQSWLDVTAESANVARPLPMVPRYVEIANAWNKELGLVWSGHKTAKEAMEAAAPAVDKILAEE